ncbi:MAG: hypothetical protein M3Q49_22260 [Actinomycetota bacterium]|nr:hypothetical protein [Actinomycetota bacterium]
MRRLLRFRGVTYGGVMLALMFLASSCSDEQGDTSGGSKEEAKPVPKEVTKEVTKMVTVAEAPKPTRDAPPTRQAPAPAPGGADPPAAPAEAPAAQEESPEDALALQYRLINAGDYEGAYALFSEQSKQLVSPGQYRTYFESNAPYSITDYSFPSVDAQGDAATVEAALTVNSASGQESYQRAQELVREGGAWRVVVRDEQASAFAAAGQETARYDESEPTPALTPDPAPEESTSQYEEPSAGDIPGDGTFLVGEDIQPGTYQTDGGGEFGCYWARLSDASGDMESIIANGNPRGPTTVTISASDGAFETSGCSDWALR